MAASDESAAQRMEAARRDFVANVSHELKTPVAAMGLLAEATVDAADDPARSGREDYCHDRFPSGCTEAVGGHPQLRRDRHQRVAADRGNRREDHDRQDDHCRQHARATEVSAEERQRFSTAFADLYRSVGEGKVDPGSVQALQRELFSISGNVDRGLSREQVLRLTEAVEGAAGHPRRPEGGASNGAVGPPAPRRPDAAPTASPPR